MIRNIFNIDFREFLASLNKFEVKYILVGDYSVIIHGYNRTTGDLDVWIEPTLENYGQLMKAFIEFGLPTNAFSQEQFINTLDQDVFSFGKPPVSIDILTRVKGLDFIESLSDSVVHEEDDLQIRVLSLNKLRTAKTAAARNKDLDDLENLPRN